jgi:hypothetical protein
LANAVSNHHSHLQKLRKKTMEACKVHYHHFL